MPTLAEMRTTISNRLDSLSDILAIKRGSPLPDDSPAFTINAIFESKQGFSKYWYYLRNSTLIDALTEFRALGQLMLHAETIVPPADPQPTALDQALLGFFQQKAQTMDTQQFIDKLINTVSPGFNKNVEGLLAELRLTNTPKKDQQEWIRLFLSHLLFDLRQSKNPKAPIIISYMNEELPTVKGLGFVKDEQIPDYLSKLLAPIDLDGRPTPAALATQEITTPQTHASTWYLFGFIPIRYRKTLERRINDQREALAAILIAQGNAYILKENRLAAQLSQAASLVKAELKSFFDSFIAACRENIKISQQPVVVPEYRRAEKANSPNQTEGESSPGYLSKAADLLSSYFTSPPKPSDPFLLPGSTPPAAQASTQTTTPSPSFFGWLWGNTKTVAPVATLPTSTANTPAIK